MNESLIRQARKASQAVYLATDVSVAAEISRLFTELADALEAKDAES